MAQVEYEIDFCNRVHDLIPDGDSVLVTGANREAFVTAYVHFLLVSSIAAQFDPFKSGFDRLCSGPVMPMFQPSELELVICGSEDLDFNDLQRTAQYDGYTQVRCSPWRIASNTTYMHTTPPQTDRLLSQPQAVFYTEPQHLHPFF